MTETTGKQPKNKGGAPKGNLNAMKHGMYSASLRAKIRGEEAATEMDSLTLGPEIELLRVLISRAVMASHGAESLDEILKALRIISLAEFNLTRLMRAQNVFDPRLTAAPAQADVEFAEVVQELADKVDDLREALEFIGEKEYDKHLGEIEEMLGWEKKEDDEEDGVLG